MTTDNNQRAGLARRLFGSFDYTPPRWLADPNRRGTATRRALGLALVVAAVAVGYWLTRPAPPNVAVGIEPPPVTPVVDDEPRPQPLALRFVAQGENGVAAAAPDRKRAGHLMTASR